MSDRLLRKVLDYLERGEGPKGIYCRRDDLGNLHGSETRRFELAEEIRAYLASMSWTTGTNSYGCVVVLDEAGAAQEGKGHG